MILIKIHSPRLTVAATSPLLQRYTIAMTRTAAETTTKRLYPSNALVKKMPPESCPPNVLKTAGITAPINTISPPTQMPSARNSRHSAQVSPHLVRRLTPAPAPQTPLDRRQSLSARGLLLSSQQMEYCGSLTEICPDQPPTAPADRRSRHLHRLLRSRSLSSDRRPWPERCSIFRSPTPVTESLLRRARA